ncbi:cellulose synthase operon protein YhjQ [Litorivivens lipolytica]|uniref:Cellulose synthase operon protein YhjQ n=1 Tax=Litorivivens lipolytica TaxID=1524264 RepID=A0A7W4Z5B5_9GAMM|nr:cellulose biosynthesis protein BcsQ [Litorivivens lipolytica]MBB3046967.1 cellulose synthase operon protein YhjQ [Litorivivens lipolytica]
MRVVVVRGVRGGGGSSTVAANLASALQKLGRSCLMLDLCQNNDLRFHASVDPREPDGWARRLVADQSWEGAVFGVEDGLRVIPFGELDHNEYDGFQELSQSVLTRFAEQVLAGFSPAVDWLVVDAPPLVSPHGTAFESLLYTFSEAASLRLLAVPPESPSYISLKFNPRVSAAAADYRLVLNRTASEVEANRDMSLVLRQEFPARVVPSQIGTDNALAEALLSLRTVDQYSPDSEATREFHALAIWCQASLVGAA